MPMSESLSPKFDDDQGSSVVFLFFFFLYCKCLLCSSVRVSSEAALPRKGEQEVADDLPFLPFVPRYIPQLNPRLSNSPECSAKLPSNLLFLLSPQKSGNLNSPYFCLPSFSTLVGLRLAPQWTDNGRSGALGAIAQ